MRTFRKYAGSLRTRLWLAKAVAVALFVCVQIPASGQEPAGEMPRLQVTAGRSIVLTTEFDVTRVAITNPEVADAIVVQPREILIDGKTPGTISFILWGPAQRVQYDLVVEAPIPGLQQHLGQLFPGEDIRVNVAGDAVVLSGNVSSNAVMLRAAEIATATGAANVINMLQLPGGTESEQVILQVRFAEVNRRAINELGLGGLFMARDRFLGRATTQQFPSPNFDLQDGRNELVFSDFLNIFFLD
ncbi:MAG: pilus assembly protein N-terminal domain-containing protein, partial [Vicinamibacterales bacterium]